MTDEIELRHQRFPTLDGVRAIAALSIVAFHVSHDGFGTFGGAEKLVQHLNAGVALFFLLSGFLLYRPFVLAAAERRQIDHPTYVKRRFFRIIPLYWFVLFTFAVWPGLPGFFAGSWLPSITLLQIYNPAWAHQGLAVAWSLCTEITFYLVLPLYALVMGRAGLRLARERHFELEIGALVVLTILSTALHAALRSGEDPNTAGVAAILPSTAYLFCGGMLLAVCSVNSDRWLSRWLTRIADHRALCWGAGVLLLFLLSYGRGGTAIGPTNPLYEPVAFLLLLPLTLAPRQNARLDRALCWRGLAWMGLISYGIYLWHDPLIGHVASAMGTIGELGDGLGVLVGTVLVTTAVASASYLIVERPAQLFSHRKHLLRRKAKPMPMDI